MTGETNLVKNGNMESWSYGENSAPDGFTINTNGSGLCQRGTYYVKMGTYAAKLTRTTGTYYMLMSDTLDAVYLSGRIITVGAWVYGSAAGVCKIGIEEYNGSTANSYYSSTNSGTSWQYLTITKTIGSGMRTVKIILYVSSGSAYFDGVTCLEGSTATVFSPKSLVDDGKTIVIDSVNNKVGINKTIPAESLDVSGNIAVSGTVDGVNISSHSHDGVNSPKVSGLNNIATGITPVASGWNLAPTNLSNATDGIFSTVTSEGRTTTVANLVGYVTINLGKVETVLVSAKVGMRTSSGNAKQYVYLEVSDDNINYYSDWMELTYTSSTVEQIRQIGGRVVTGRYLRLKFWGTNAYTHYVKIYEILAFRLGCV